MVSWEPLLTPPTPSCFYAGHGPHTGDSLQDEALTIAVLLRSIRKEVTPISLVVSCVCVSSECGFGVSLCPSSIWTYGSHSLPVPCYGESLLWEIDHPPHVILNFRVSSRGATRRAVVSRVKRGAWAGAGVSEDRAGRVRGQGRPGPPSSPSSPLVPSGLLTLPCLPFPSSPYM